MPSPIACRVLCNTIRPLAQELGLTPLLPKPNVGLTFALVNRGILGPCKGPGNALRLTRVKKTHILVKDIFLEPEGIYFIHAHHYHADDMGVGEADPINHYIVYNACTRVLYLNPEVILILVHLYSTNAYAD